MVNEDKVTMRKARAALGAEHRLRQRLETIDWEERVRNRELADLAARLDAGETVEITALERGGV